jgi:hypothetical protein
VDRAPAVGARWEHVSAVVTFRGVGLSKAKTSLTIVVVGRERVRVPAGEFESLRVDAVSPAVNFSAKHASLRFTYWYSTTLQRGVRISRRQYCTHPGDNSEDVLELVSFRPANQ